MKATALKEELWQDLKRNKMELLLFILIAYGLTQILVYSDMPIIKRLRPDKESYRGYGKVFHCPMCMGFHVGWFLVLLSPWTELFTFDPTLVNAFILGCLSSATSYVLNMVFSDDGIQIRHNYRYEQEEGLKGEEWWTTILLRNGACSQFVFAAKALNSRG